MNNKSIRELITLVEGTLSFGNNNPSEIDLEVADILNKISALELKLRQEVYGGGPITSTVFYNTAASIHSVELDRLKVLLSKLPTHNGKV